VNEDNWKDRLGFACKIAGAQIKTSDMRRPQNGPHLKYSCEMMMDVLRYMEQNNLRIYRMPSEFCPYPTHPDYPELNWKKQFKEAKGELDALRDHLKEYPVRLSFHPSQFVLLSSPNQEITRRSVHELRWQAEMLDRLECPEEARVLIHLGGVYGEREKTKQRIIRNIQKLPKVVKNRLALENDDVSWGARDTLDVCRETQTPMIFDFHHHACLNGGESWDKMLRGALKTWPKGVRPKTHLSSPKLMARDEKTLQPGPIRAHSDYIDPWMFSRLMQRCEELGLPPFDIMLEAKAKDLAVIRLREQLDSFKPHVLP